jgi:hypothetical protein
MEEILPMKWRYINDGVIHIKKYDACFYLTIIGPGRSTTCYCQLISYFKSHGAMDFLFSSPSIKKDGGFVNSELADS